jgi:NAD(P)H-hydrate epimerase
VAVVGGGSNGGDALVALRSLRLWGRDVAYLPLGSEDPDPDLFCGHPLARIPDAHIDAAFAGAAVLVDGIMGTGARGAPRAPAADIIERMNRAAAPIVALDIPSGVDPSTGEVPGVAVEADATIMFGCPKTGALFQPGRSLCGRLLAVEIGFPPLRDEEATAALITPDWARARLPVRAQDAHKNSVGRVTVVAGRKGMAGAAAIAAHSAMRAGAGYVRIVTEEANRVIVQGAVPEAIFVDRSDLDAVVGAVTDCDAVLIGPAIGTGPDAESLLDAVLGALNDRGCVLDADALTILAGRGTATLEGLPARAILTPHPGEMQRLTQRSAETIRSDPMAVAQSLAESTGAVVLLKGAPSVVAAPGAPVLVSTTGSSDLATAAMGDQLGAEAAAFLAAGAPAPDAAALALFFGGRAAEIAERGRSLTPHDVADALGSAFADPGPPRSTLDLPFVVFDQPPRW